MTDRLFVALFFMLMLVVSSARAETSEVIPDVDVTSRCDDDLAGQSIVYKFKEGLRESSSMNLVGANGKPFLIVSVICQPSAMDGEQYSTSISYAIFLVDRTGRQFNPFPNFITHGVMVCGTEKLDSCANSLIATLDDEWQKAINILAENFVRREAEGKKQ